MPQKNIESRAKQFPVVAIAHSQHDVTSNLHIMFISLMACTSTKLRHTCVYEASSLRPDLSYNQHTVKATKHGHTSTDALISTTSPM